MTPQSLNAVFLPEENVSLQVYQQKMIDLMTQQELTLAELYQFLSKRYSAHEEFWISLQGEELKHAQWVEYLGARVAEGAAIFREDKTRTYTVQAYIDFLKSSIHKFKTTTMPFKAALALAVDIEGSLLERKVLQHFQGDDPELVKTLQKLSLETAEHLKKVKAMLLTTNE